MPVGQMLKDMSTAELMMWAEYFKVVAVENEMARNRAKSQQGMGNKK